MSVTLDQHFSETTASRRCLSVSTESASLLGSPQALLSYRSWTMQSITCACVGSVSSTWQHARFRVWGGGKGGGDNSLQYLDIWNAGLCAAHSFNPASTVLIYVVEREQT